MNLLKMISLLKLHNKVYFTWEYCQNPELAIVADLNKLPVLQQNTGAALLWSSSRICFHRYNLSNKLFGGETYAENNDFCHILDIEAPVHQMPTGYLCFSV